jgi:hypothetical protein
VTSSLACIAIVVLASLILKSGTWLRDNTARHWRDFDMCYLKPSSCVAGSKVLFHFMPHQSHSFIEKSPSKREVLLK